MLPSILAVGCHILVRVRILSQDNSIQYCVVDKVLGYHIGHNFLLCIKADCGMTNILMDDSGKLRVCSPFQL